MGRYFYYHWNGAAMFVKEAELFTEQGGLTQPWGYAWTPIEADDIEDARHRALQLREEFLTRRP